MAADSQTSASGNDHARMLRDSVADFVKRGTDIKRVRRLRDTQPGFERPVWQQMAEFGWLGILVRRRVDARTVDGRCGAGRRRDRARRQ